MGKLNIIFCSLLLSACCTTNREKVLGSKEIADLPALGILSLELKVDTGAATSSLHAENVEVKEQNGKKWVYFQFEEKALKAELVIEKSVKNSAGMVTIRPTIRTPIRIGNKQWDILVTLISRERMKNKMLLGREGIPDGYLIDTHRSMDSSATNSEPDESSDHMQQSPTP